jgi:hypothetical protein
MNENNKILTFSDTEFQKFMRDRAQVSGGKTCLRGRVIMRDENGKVLLEKDNEIVLRGRTFALEKLFGAVITGSTYIQNLERSIALFKIGAAGAPNGDPFNPFVPEFSDMDVAEQVPFITVDPNKFSDPEKASNKSIVTELSDVQELKYYIATVDPLDPAVTHYYGKTFENSQWHINQAGNEVYRELTLLISDTDCRGAKINELCLMLAYYDTPGNTFSQIEAFSRICFDTESFSNLSKTCTISYLIYA